MRFLNKLNLLKKLAVLPLFGSFVAAAQADILDEVEHGYADNNGVKIHYATVGEGPLVVMVHGFPDFWYSWHHQMEELKDNFKVVAIDQRGYNLSDQPEAESSYAMSNLVGDIAAVIRHFGEEKANIVGHDWGGLVSWQFALALPEMVENLVILNLPHPNGMNRELANNEEQQKNSDYARRFIAGKSTDPDIFFGAPMNPQTLSAWVTDPLKQEAYIEAFERSNFDGMLAYYKQNYPRGADLNSDADVPRLNMPVLVFHGLEDKALHSDGLNNTWDWIDADTTIATVPGAGHFVQQDAAELVSNTLKWWLIARQ
tara:strand:+ start:4732 stop:5673 length:942 start_codon:yes stop_codon:yes gene_type:complete